MTKNNVLAILMQTDKFVSGEAISRQLGLSRTAVNIAVKALRAEGYEIRSVTNRGYQLVSAPDVLTSGALMGCLPRERMAEVISRDSVGSTNQEVMRMALEGAPHGRVVIADRQESGRGRKGREFASPGGKGIYMSYLMIPTQTLRQRVADTGNNMLWSSITSWTAVTAARVIEKMCGIRPGIKWVNDLYMNGRKICGILTQTSFDAETMELQNITIGIGINVSEEYEDFPKELRETAGSILSETGVRVIRARLAAELIKALDEMCSRWPDDMQSYLEEYRSWNIVPGRKVTVNYGTSSEEVTAIGIADDFSLTVEDAAGVTKQLISGDVSLKL